MAVRTVDRTKTTTGWNSKTFFPKDNYIIRCVSADNKPSASGNKMVTLEWEIVNQEPRQIGDKLVDLNGVKFSSWHVLEVKDEKTKELDAERSDAALERYLELLENCGVEIPEEGIDDANPPTPKGKVVHACVYGREQKSYASPTPEQRAKGDRVGDVLKDPITGKEQIVYNPTIDTVYGQFDGEVQNPF